MVSVEGAVSNSTPERAIVIDDAERIDERPELCIVWAFLWHFAPVRDDALWPQTIDEFQAACLATVAPPEFGSDAKAPYVPSLVPILEWAAELCQVHVKRSRDEKEWPRWLKSWVGTRLQAPECRLTDLWEGVNRLEAVESLWDLPWLDKLILLKTLTDFLLTHCDAIRDDIKKYYDVVSNKDLIRSAARNPLVVESLGKDSKLRTYWQIDDTARIWESGNPYRMKCPLTSRAHTEQDIKAFARTLSKPKPQQSPPKLAPIFITKPTKKANDPLATEHALRAKLEDQVLPKLEAGVKRMQEIEAKREQLLRDHEDRQLEEIRREQQEALRAQQREDRKSRLRAPKPKADSDDEFEDDEFVGNGDLDGYGSDHEAPRKRRRGLSTESDEEPFYVDDPELLLAGRSTRRSETPMFGLTERRGGRKAALNVPNGYANVAAPSRSTRSRRTDDAASGKLPRGAKREDYDLTALEDVEVWQGSRMRIIKGSLTAQAEIAQQLAEDAQLRVEQLEAGREAPHGHLPLLPKDADPADYELESLEDTIVWSRTREMRRKGAITAAKEVAAQLDADAARLVEFAEAANNPGDHSATPPKRSKLNIFGRPMDNDAYTDEGEDTGEDANSQNEQSEEVDVMDSD